MQMVMVDSNNFQQFSLLGDLVPRRPKLKAEQKLNGVDYTHAESLSDMRTISSKLISSFQHLHVVISL